MDPRTYLKTKTALQPKSFAHSEPAVARPKVVVKCKIILVCLDVVCYHSRSYLYLCLHVLSEPRVVDVVREFWRMHNFDRVPITLSDLEKRGTLALNTKCSIDQLLRGKMREDVG